MEKGIKFYIRVAGVLFVVCAITALLLSAIHGLTKDKIETNAVNKMNATIAEIFKGDIKTEKVEVPLSSTVKDVYKVTCDDDLVGYAVHVVPMGFKGDIDMMVGVDQSGKCIDVKIISLSETPGLGSKVGDEIFLAQYQGGDGNYTVKGDIQPVAGATISSAAVTDGVNAAIDVLMTGGMLK